MKTAAATEETAALVTDDQSLDRSREELPPTGHGGRGGLPHDDGGHRRDGVHRCCFGRCACPGSNHRRKHGTLSKVLMGWANLSGVLRGSPALLRWFARLAVGWVTVYAVLRLSRDAFHDVPWAQQARGASMPLLSYSFRTHREQSWWTVPAQDRRYDDRSTTRSLATMTDMKEDGRAEWQRCDDDEDKCGASVSFPRGRMTLRSDQIVALRFPIAGIRAALQIKNASLAFEMYGEKELFPAIKPEQSAPLTIEIQVELSTHALALQDQEHGIASRELTNSTVIWAVPPQQKHHVVETPNLAPLLTVLKSMDGWTEESSVNIILTPTSGTGVRIFKAPDKRTGANMHILHDLVKILCAISCVLILRFMATHGRSSPAERLVHAIMALEGPKCGCAVDHREHADCKPEKLRVMQAELQKVTGKGQEEISDFLVAELVGLSASEHWHIAKRVRSINKMQIAGSGAAVATPDAFARYKSTEENDGGWWVSDKDGSRFQTLRGALMAREVDGPQGLRRRAETMLPDSEEIGTTKEELVDSLVRCFALDTWSGDRISQGLFFSALASGTLLPPPGNGRSWNITRWLFVSAFLFMAVMSAVARAIKFGRESFVEFEHDETYASVIDGTLFVASIFEGQLMILWIAMFTLTCSISASAIDHAVSTFKDKIHNLESGDLEREQGAEWRQAVLDTIYRIDKVADMLNNDWQTIQLLNLMVFLYLLYETLIDLAIQDTMYRDPIDFLNVPMNLAAILALLYPAAMVTAATDEVKMELARINEIYQHVHPTLSREIAQLISHVNCKEMGYKLFETFTLSTGSIKTVFSLATTVFLMPLWTAAGE